MKVKLLTVLLAFMLGATGLSSVPSLRWRERAEGAEEPAAARALIPVAAAAAPAAAATANPAPRMPEGVIDGAKNPEKIPDRVAYSLLFRFLSGRTTDEEKARARSYLKMVFSCSDCQDAAAFESNEAEIEAVLAAAGEFERRVQRLDLQAKAIKDQAGAQVSREDKLKLTKLQRQKDSLVDEVAASLSGRLGEKGAQKMRRFVREHMKAKIKITPAPAGRKAQPGNSVA